VPSTKEQPSPQAFFNREKVISARWIYARDRTTDVFHHLTNELEDILGEEAALET
jgi:hypothetical protein